jgi:O-glycosyl hydrolase
MQQKTILILILILSIAGKSRLHADTIFCTHKVILDAENKLLPWYIPQEKAYDHYLHLRWEFIKNRVPNAPGPLPRSLYPQYYFYCAFKENNGVLEPDTWMNDIGEKIPNWFESARLYYAYTGDSSVMQIVKDFIDYTLGHGTSPATFVWPNFPYTAANAGDTLFRGFSSANRLKWHEIQVDHAGEMGLTYYRMYQFTGEEKYLKASLHVADVLAQNAKEGTATQSVWPYRVIMENGKITAPYGANWTGCYMLLENLICAYLGNVGAYKTACEKARLFFLQYPMKTGYWTDGHSDTDIKSNTYKSNLSASNITLCMFDYPELDPEWKTDIPKLIKWTEDNFIFRGAPGEPSTMWGANLVGEQDSFIFKMEYQTARYAAACAQWYAISGDESYKGKAFRSLNWVTYCNDSTGMAFESPVSKGINSWWSDCYGESPRMFYQAFAGIPEWAPPHENHILYSAGILRDVQYRDDRIRYYATAQNGIEYIRVAFKPLLVTLQGKVISQTKEPLQGTYTLKNLGDGDYSMAIYRDQPGEVIISGNEFSIHVDGAVRLQLMDGIGVNANTGSWDGGQLKPALDLLLDSMNATIWRVIVESVEKWEDVNDNDDPYTFNWEYYNRLYETPKFRKAWDMIEYLNDKGVRDNLMLNVMGRLPAWMGDSIVRPGLEDEYVEMLLSFIIYARNIRHVEIGLFGPMNEPDIRKEGPTVGPMQYAYIIKKLVGRMNALNLAGIKIVAPDVAGMDRGVRDYFPLLLTDPVIMANMGHLGLHSYGGYYAPAREYLEKSAYPTSSLWMTECNAWRNGLDDGQVGLYDYNFARECVHHMIDLIRNGASACMLWEGYDSYYEHHAPSPFSYWGILGYGPATGTYSPRKHFYAVSQLSKFITAGSMQIGVTESKGFPVLAFYNLASSTVTLTGINETDATVMLKGILKNLPVIESLEMYITSEALDFQRTLTIAPSGEFFQLEIPANCIFTVKGQAKPGSGAVFEASPEPENWYAGDIHVHRNCGEVTFTLAEPEFTAMMEPNDLAVISVLADMGNGEVKDSRTDLPKVNGKDALQSKPGRLVHWDAEWHFDPAGVTFENQALGGHLVFLGLKEAHTLWDEPADILAWAKKQGAVKGFCHMQYLNDSVQHELTCCIPMDYPVEAALGTIDFLSEDVGLNDASVHAYYKILNCGFRLGWAAGTDFPCNSSKPLGSLLTYVEVKNKPITYQAWVEGIRDGRTVVTSNGHAEFLELKVNGTATPGDEIRIRDKRAVNVEATWTSVKEQTGRIEVVCNGRVVAVQPGTAKPGKPVTMHASVPLDESSWICARRMDDAGHRSHTAPVYISLNNKPVRASAEDAQYFVRWIDNILEKTSPGGPWNRYVPHDLKGIQERYRIARAIYEKIAAEAKVQHSDWIK